MNKLFGFLLAKLPFFAVMSSAHADTCTFKGTYSCNSSGVNICQVVAGNVQCDLTNGTGDSSPGSLTAITYGGNWEVWGQDAEGVDFCGVLSPTNEFHAWGGQYDDTLDLNYDTGVGVEHLTNASSFLHGRDGDDLILGADNTTVADHLYGDNDNDVIRGLDGDDECYGGNHADTIYGGVGNDLIYGDAGLDTLHGDAGDDVMYGGANSDSMTGDAGSDEMYGEADPDYMTGGDNDDFMDGGAAGDVMCGDTAATSYGGDTLDAGDAVNEPNPDLLWGAEAGDTDYGYLADGTRWDGVAATGGCAAHPTLGSRPLACP